MTSQNTKTSDSSIDLTKEELLLINNRIRDSLSNLRNFFDSTDTIEIDSYSNLCVSKIYAKKNKYHNHKSLLVFPAKKTVFDATCFVKSCLMLQNKNVITQDAISGNSISKYIDFFQSTSTIDVIVDEQNIIVSNNNQKMQLFGELSYNRAGIEFLARSASILLASCGKNVSSNIDCFEINEYGISKLNNHLTISELTKDKNDDSEDLRERIYL